MKKIVTFSEALQKWADGRSIEVSLNIKLLTLEDLQWPDDMGAIFSHEVAEQDPGVKEPAITIEYPWEEESDNDQMPTMSFAEMLGEEAPPEAEEQKEPVKKRKRIDVGKVKALRNAGWSLQKIADEMGCCPQTVANVLNRDEKA